jgi:hypothetical protein
MKRKHYHLSSIIFLLIPILGFAQIKWTNVDSQFGPLPASVHVFKTTDMLDGKPNIAFYITAELGEKDLRFNTDTSHKRRLTPAQFYEKNERPLIVVNTTFFSFQTNQNLNAVIKDGKLVGYNIHSVPGRGKDTFTYRHPRGSAIGISKKRKADVAWLYTDSSLQYPYAWQVARMPVKDSSQKMLVIRNMMGKKWKMQSAVGGGPVLVQDAAIKITNNEELKFAGNAVNDKHPRTAMGYTRDGKLIILVVQGRFPGVAEGADLNQLAKMLKDIGCVEALNLDGGGSSCMLVNGKETIKPSDPAGQRAVPAVFLVH